ncbi:LytTR family DNA-binding domain-containing protein, partial [Acetoanaerobium noterae]
SFSAACDKLMEFSCFMKTHRSYIVNMQYVDTIENTKVTLQNHETIPVAQGKAKDMKQQYLNYQMEGE